MSQEQCVTRCPRPEHILDGNANLGQRLVLQVNGDALRTVDSIRGTRVCKKRPEFEERAGALHNGVGGWAERPGVEGEDEQRLLYGL